MSNIRKSAKADLVATLDEYYKTAKRKRKKGVIWMFYVCPDCGEETWTTDISDDFTVCRSCSKPLSLSEL